MLVRSPALSQTSRGQRGNGTKLLIPYHRKIVTLTLFIFAASIALIYMYNKPGFLRSRRIYWFTPYIMCR